MTTTTTIQSVTKSKNSGLWVITDAKGERYATKSEWKASIAQRAKEREKVVEIWHWSGWYYRELRSIAEVA